MQASQVATEPIAGPSSGNRTMAKIANTPTLAPPSIIGPAAP